jgi:N-acetylglucosaminyldiphosphoundecaprenol N-acetyl-beta-D-mannosaminyltransferase
LVSERVDILGVKISATNLAAAVDTIEGWIQRKEPHYVCVTPAHGVMDGRRDPELMKILNESGLTTPDGMSIVWLLKLYGHKCVTRVYGPDLMLAVCQLSGQKGFRQFLYGGDTGVAENLARSLQGRFPGLQINDTYTPPFRPLTAEEDQEVIDRINRSEADIVWIGISTPKQERWMAEHVGKVNAPVLIGVGAAFDFLSGRKPQAPSWMQRNGMEWLFRFFTEPRRLWRRYFQYPTFVFLVLSQFIRSKSTRQKLIR